MKVPSAEESVSIDVPEVVVEDNITLGGLSVAIPLPDGTVAARLMFPENPLELVIVRVDDPEDPELMINDSGLEVIL